MLLIYAEYNSLPMHFQWILLGIGIMISLVIARQVIAIHETTHLSQQLKSELIKRQNTQEKLEYSLREKEILLKEIHHRVKNNLQVVSSMLTLQAAQIKDPFLIDTLMDSQNRVQSMALIHEKLYQSTNLSQVDFAGYLESLVSFLYRSIISIHKDVTLNVRAEPVKLEIDLAVLVSNALKHAFPDRNKGEITIQLRSRPDNQVEMVVCDDGVGIPESIDIQNSPSLGLQLVNALVNQLDGDLKYRNSRGSQFTITFYKSQPVSVYPSQVDSTGNSEISWLPMM